MLETISFEDGLYSLIVAIHKRCPFLIGNYKPPPLPIHFSSLWPNYRFLFAWISPFFGGRLLYIAPYIIKVIIFMLMYWRIWLRKCIFMQLSDSLCIDNWGLTYMQSTVQCYRWLCCSTCMGIASILLGPTEMSTVVNRSQQADTDLILAYFIVRTMRVLHMLYHVIDTCNW